MQKNQFFKVQNSFLETKKDFIELKDKYSNNREVKIKTDIEELLFKQTFVCISKWISLNKKELRK